MWTSSEGTGKTLLAKAAATETGATFIELKISDVVRGEIGESEKVRIRRTLTPPRPFHPLHRRCERLPRQAIPFIPRTFCFARRWHTNSSRSFLCFVPVHVREWRLKAIDRAFRTARELAPSIVFIDEFQALFASRDVEGGTG